MKRIFLLALMLGLFVSLNAQTDKGSMILGGGLDLNAGSSKSKSEYDGTSIETDGPSHMNFYLGPRFGYFIMDGLAVGLDLGLGYNSSSKDKDDYSSTYSSMTFSAGPFARYYYKMGKLAPFGHVNVGFGGGSSKSEVKISNVTTTEENTGSLMNYGVGVGAAYFLSDNIALEGIIAYRSNQTTDTEKGKDGEKDRKYTNTIGGENFGIGFNIFLK